MLILDEYYHMIQYKSEIIIVHQNEISIALQKQ